MFTQESDGEFSRKPHTMFHSCDQRIRQHKVKEPIEPPPLRTVSKPLKCKERLMALILSKMLLKIPELGSTLSPGDKCPGNSIVLFGMPCRHHMSIPFRYGCSDGAEHAR